MRAGGTQDSGGITTHWCSGLLTLTSGKLVLADGVTVKQKSALADLAEHAAQHRPGQAGGLGSRLCECCQRRQLERGRDAHASAAGIHARK